MKRVLCIRFPNWPIQCLRKRLRDGGNASTTLALHTASPTSGDDRKQKSAVDEDTRFLRSLFPAALGGPAIVAVSSDAWAQGVRPGMPLAEARSMAQPMAVTAGGKQQSTKATDKTAPNPAVEFHEWQPQADRDLLKLTAELTRRYAPIVGLDDVPMPDSLLLDITGCGPLFGGESGLAESLLKDLRTAGWSCRIAIAEAVSTVWALTHTEKPRPQEHSSAADRRKSHRTTSESILHELPIQIIPPGQDRAEVNPLPVAASRLELADLEILKHLGIRSIGQLLSLPREDLPSRLSATAVMRVQQLQGVLDESIQALPEANPVAATWSSDDPACGLADIQHILQHLTEQISEQLTRRRMACSSVVCEFRGADGKTTPLAVSVVKPTQSHELLHEVLCMRVETLATHEALEAAANEGPRDYEKDNSDSTVQIDSLTSRPFLSVRMVATVAPLPVAKQKDLFSVDEHIVPQEELATLISRLSGRLGTESVCTVRTHADPRPDLAILAEPVLVPGTGGGRQSQLDARLRKLTEPISEPIVKSKESSMLIPSRPLRLLETPQPITGMGDSRTFPRTLLFAGQTFQLQEYTSPERIQTAWWTDHPCHRDYYTATSRNGSRFWLFRDLHSGLWWLHGVFD